MAYKAGRCLLKKLLRARGISQRDLADRAGMSESQVSQYATNKQVMNLDTAKTIAAAIGCHIDDLYEWIKVPRRQRTSRRTE